MSNDLSPTPSASARDERLAFHPSEFERGISERFRFVISQVAPDHDAWVGANERMTYAELDAASARLAAELVDLVGGGAPACPQKPIALLLPHDGSSLVGILGTLKTGHFYVPLDLSAGEATLHHILRDSSPCALVTTSALYDEARGLGPDPAMPLVCVDELPPRATEEPSERVLNAGSSIVHLQYTSGSTGQPRGVIRTHRQQLYSVYASRNEQDYAPTDRVTHLLSYAYAFSSTPLFGGFLNGATLCAASLREMTPSALYEWLARERITKLQASVGSLRGLADLAGQRPPLADLRAISTGGEPMTRDEVERLSSLLPTGCKLTVRLASTEATTYARFSVHVGTPWQGDRTPAGYVPDGVQVYILDEAGQPTPPGVPGQIAVRSPFLSLGYWNQPELTVQRYLPDPEAGDRRIFLTGDLGRFRPDGMLEHLGRMDLMVKIRGYRVEPEAIEAALAAHSAVRECVVVAHTGRDGEARLIAYYVPRQMPGPTISELRQHLVRTLPEYMIPSRFVALEALPRILNGKVDRRVLPAPGRARPALATPYVSPRTDTETRLAEIWAEVLDLDEVGAEDNFMELGGDSLSALHMMLTVEERLGKALPAGFYHQPTLANLAGLVSAPLAGETGSVLTPTATAMKDEDSLRGEAAASPPALALSARLRRAAIVRGPVLGQVGLPYRLGTWLQRSLLGMRTLQSGLLRRRAEVFDRCRAEAGLDDPQRTLLTTNLMANTWQLWRLRALQRPACFRRYMQVEGAAALEEALARRRGMLLVFLHQACAVGLARAALKARGREQAFTLGNILSRVGGSAMIPVIMKRIHRAHSDLQHGGIVLVAGDGRMGSGGLSVPFHGHTLTLRRGFAELALSTQPAVVAVFTSMSVEGNMTLEFCALPTPRTKAEEDNVIFEYAGMLRERWPRLLSTLYWGWLEYLSSLPPSA